VKQPILARIIHEGPHNPPFGLRRRPSDGPSLRASPEPGAQRRVEARGAQNAHAAGANERTRSVRE